MINSMITSSPYEEKYPGIISNKLAGELGINKVYYFSQVDTISDFSYIDKKIKYEKLFHNYDYSKYTSENISSSSIPLETLYELEKYKTSIIYNLVRWKKNYNNSAHKVDIEILYYKLLNYWYSFIKESKVSLVILWTPHGVDDTMIYYISKVLKLRLFVENHQLMKDYKDRYRMIITEGLSNFLSGNKKFRELPDDLLHLFNSISHSKEESKDLFSKFNSSISSSSRLATITKFYKYIFKRFIVHLRARKFKQIYRKTKLLFRKLIFDVFLLKYYRLISSNETNLIDSNYYYFPLHFQPEATTSLYGGIFVEQLNAIRYISNILPENCKLIVKEHPAYFMSKYSEHHSSIYESRSKFFYDSLKNLRNVTLASYNYDSRLLIKNSIGVVTINGTVVMEALSFSKKSLIFGDHYYKNLPNVFTQDNIEHYFETKNEIVYKSKFKNYLLDLANSSYVFYFPNTHKNTAFE